MVTIMPSEPAIIQPSQVSPFTIIHLALFFPIQGFNIKKANPTKKKGKNSSVNSSVPSWGSSPCQLTTKK